ncbi:hypothetical protein JXO59_02940 [candidate division KSB1 bacterium]|nr:hypothetical protein [candidate division KSB1 bacterium]
MKHTTIFTVFAFILALIGVQCDEDDKGSPTAPPVRDAVQITLNSEDLTITTTGVPIAILRESGLTIPEEGENRVWDYYRAGSKSVGTDEWSPVPAAPAFTGANTTYIDNYNILGFNVAVVEYFQKDADGQQCLGSTIDSTLINLDISGASFLHVPDQTVPYTPVKKLLYFPMAYGDQAKLFEPCTRMVEARITYALLGFFDAPIGYKVKFERTSTVAGWGLLLLPNYSIAFDVLLVRSDLTETEEFYLNGVLAPQETLTLFGLTQNKVTQITEYSFYARNNPQAVLVIQVKEGLVSYAQMMQQANNE